MAKILASYALLVGLALAPMSARAHCDAADGPVATAAIRALDTRNVNLILPFAPAQAEPELSVAFKQALSVREKGPEAKALADHYFMETAVRLHRAGEGAPYTGLKPAGTDFGPAIPAAEKALKIGKSDDLTALIAEQVAHGIEDRYRDAMPHSAAPAMMAPSTAADVAKARERVSAELAFIGYIEGIYLATKGGVHVEAAATTDHHQGTD
ncbi:DUF6448 family protein [Sinorhizobium sp. GL28]|uniref:DUF6448 family protein n=1 Tax=Sinorhizobium sp. GL28 TaxID=1358418 RepID=UPI00071D2653|nr:DUF6448 family protein [Sinorhizobium sp. GL28]KSV85413.1 hypothetical protein N184_33450 [Sinorhizobium sp. GL28]